MGLGGGLGGVCVCVPPPPPLHMSNTGYLRPIGRNYETHFQAWETKCVALASARSGGCGSEVQYGPFVLLGWAIEMSYIMDMMMGAGEGTRR